VSEEHREIIEDGSPDSLVKPNDGKKPLLNGIMHILSNRLFADASGHCCQKNIVENLYQLKKWLSLQKIIF